MKGILFLTFAVSVAVAGSALAGRNLNWVGGGTNAKWSTAGNWIDAAGGTNAVPRNGDALTLDGDTIGVTENDLLGLELDRITLTGGWMKPTGNPAVFREGARGIVCSDSIEYGMPLCLEGTNIVVDLTTSGKPFKLTGGVFSYNDKPCGFVKSGPGRFLLSTGKGSDFTNFKYVRIDGGTFSVCDDINDDITKLPSGLEYAFTSSETVFRLGKDYDLVDGCFYESGSAVGGTHVFKTLDASNLTLTMSGTPKTDPLLLTASFNGNFSFCWNPSSSDKRFVLSGSVSDTKGRVTVSNGVFRLTNGATFTQLSELTLAGGVNSRFEMDTNPVTAFSCTSLKLVTGTERLVLSEGVALTFGAISVNGQNLEPGYYTGVGGALGTEVPWIEGAGAVMIPGVDVAPVAYSWTGLGGDTLVSNPENWRTVTGTPRSVPLNRGTMAVTVEHGSTITLDENVVFYGMNVSSSAGNVVFSGNHTLALGAGGFRSASKTDCFYTLGAVHLLNPQAWTTEANVTLNLNGAISGFGANTLTLNTAGIVNFNAENRFTDPLIVNKGTLHVSADNALGMGNAVVIDGSQTAVTFHGGTWTSRIDFKNAATELRFAADTTNVFMGAVQNVDNAVWGWTVEAGGVVRFKGGNNRGSSAWTVINGPGETHFDSPTSYGDSCIDGTQSKIYFNAEGCEVGSGGMYVNLELHTTVPRAFSSAKLQRIRMRGPAEGVFWDLHGCDQWLKEFQAKSANNLVKSEKGALLHLLTDDYVATSSTNLATFAGGAGVSFDGATFLRLATPSISTGTVQVTSGRLEMATTWPNATSAVVQGGLLKIENCKAFGRDTALVVAAEAKVDLAYDGVLRVGALYIDGIRQADGAYGASGAGANPKGVFTGSGLLRVGVSCPILIYR